MNTSRARTLRAIGLVGLIVGPASLIATSLIQWMNQPSDASTTVIDIAQQHPVAWLTASLFAVFGPLVWLAGIPAVIGLVVGRGWALTVTGGYLTAIGLAAAVGHLALYFGVFSAVASSGISNDAVDAMGRSGDQDPLSNALLVLFLICFSLGPIVLTMGLRRAGVVAVWVPVAAIVMTVANFVGGPVAGIVQLCALLLTFVPIIVAVARPGTRPAAATPPAPRYSEAPSAPSAP